VMLLRIIGGSFIYAAHVHWGADALGL
jgi:hypothetical protein